MSGVFRRPGNGYLTSYDKANDLDRKRKASNLRRWILAEVTVTIGLESACKFGSGRYLDDFTL